MDAPKVVLNKNCPCQNVKCENHGNCVECKKRHNDSPHHSLTACQKLNAEQQ